MHTFLCLDCNFFLKKANILTKTSLSFWQQASVTDSDERTLRVGNSEVILGTETRHFDYHGCDRLSGIWRRGAVSLNTHLGITEQDSGVTGPRRRLHPGRRASAQRRVGHKQDRIQSKLPTLLDYDTMMTNFYSLLFVIRNHQIVIWTEYFKESMMPSSLTRYWGNRFAP